MGTNTEINHEGPLVSILMLTYNRASFIKEAILSIQDQTYQNWELIIIDDGSTDDTSKIINSLNERRINYIRHETNNGAEGMIKRRQESLSLAKGEYVAVLDSDDIWTDQNKLKEQVSHLESNKTHAIVGTFVTLIDERGDKIGNNEYETNDRAIRDHIFFRNQFTHSSVLMRNSIIKKTEGYRQTTLAEDYDLFLQIGKYGEFANIPKHYTSYRIHGNSFNHKRLLMAKAVLKIVRSHKGEYPNYYLALIKCYARIMITAILKPKQIFAKH